jgi:hypothetical protein
MKRIFLLSLCLLTPHIILSASAAAPDNNQQPLEVFIKTNQSSIPHLTNTPDYNGHTLLDKMAEINNVLMIRDLLPYATLSTVKKACRVAKTFGAGEAEKALQEHAQRLTGS